MRRFFLIGIMLLVTALPLGAFAQTNDAATMSSPATGHAAVIAQGVEPLPAENVRWQVANIRIDPASSPVGVARPGFVLADRMPVLVTIGVDSEVRLAPGEATFVPAAGGTVTTLSDAVATAKVIGLADASVAASGALFAGESFAAPSGRRDIDLVRDVLKPKEHTQIENGDSPAGILVLKGGVTVKNANGGTLELTAGKAGSLSGPLTVTVTSTTSASFVVGVIGPEVAQASIEPNDVTPTVPAIATSTGIASGTGAITIATYLCPAGVSVAQAAPDTCGGNGGLGSGQFTLTGGALDGPQDAFTDQGVWTWGEIAAGQYVISVANPDGYTDFAIDRTAGASHVGDTIPVSLGSGGVVQINVYFLAAGNSGGSGTSTLGLRFYDCPIGTTVDVLSGSGDPGCTELTEPFGVTLSSDALATTETTSTLQAVSPQPSMDGSYHWTDLPAGTYTLTIDPVAQGDQFYVVRPCGDQSCPRVNEVGTSATFEIQDGEGFVLIIYRLPGS